MARNLLSSVMPWAGIRRPAIGVGGKASGFREARLTMTQFLFMPFLETGNIEVDDDHRALFAIVNRLADPDERQCQDLVRDTLDALNRYTGEHFAREEAWMRSIGWPETDEHVREHTALAAKVAAWRQKSVEHWQPWLGGTVFVITCDWLLHHVVDSDARIAVFARTGRVLPRAKRKLLSQLPRADVAAHRAA